MEKIKVILFLIMFSCLGMLSAIIVYHAVSPSIVNASNPCVDEECELGYICVSNADGATKCVEDSSGECKTRAC